MLDDLNTSTVLVLLADGCRVDEVAVYYDRLEMLGKDWEMRAKANGDELLYKFAIARPGDVLAPMVREQCGLGQAKAGSVIPLILDMRDGRAYYVGETEICSTEGKLAAFLRNFERGNLERRTIAFPAGGSEK